MLNNEQLVLGERTASTYEVLREWIVSGQLEPGASISQLELTRRLGVSRTPLREALRSLASDGLILETEAHRRVAISPLSMSHMEEIYTMRIPMAAIAALQTIPQLTVMDIAEARNDIMLIDSDEILIARDAHRRLHATLEKHAGPQIREQLTRLMLHSERYQRAFARQTKKGRKDKEMEHISIIRACETGNVIEARNLLINHMASTAFGLMQKFSHTPTALPIAVEMALCIHKV